MANRNNSAHKKGVSITFRNTLGGRNHIEILKLFFQFFPIFFNSNSYESIRITLNFV